VHPKILSYQKLPQIKSDLSNANQILKTRYDDINSFEKYLDNNGILVLKFFLHVSKNEQKRRFLERINDTTKNWKFTPNDLSERQYWNDYMHAYQEILEHTSTNHAPWHIIPADKKWYMRALVCSVLKSKLESLHLHYPVVSSEQKKEILKAKTVLMKEA